MKPLKKEDVKWNKRVDRPDSESDGCFMRSDVLSAKEWLKEQIDKDKEPLWYTDYSGNRKINSVYLKKFIDEALNI